RARRPALARLRPAGLVHGDPRPRGEARHPRDAAAEEPGGGRIAGRDRRDVRAVTVRVLRRHELVRVELVAREKAVDVEACADDLVVAGAFREARARLTDAVEARRRLEPLRRGRVAAQRAAEPEPEPGRARPAAFARPRHAVLDVEQGWVIRRDPAVDDADDHVLALQAE